jgi:photosystem II stability/assembly factor-like uncharacterized protein
MFRSSSLRYCKWSLAGCAAVVCAALLGAPMASAAAAPQGIPGDLRQLDMVSAQAGWALAYRGTSELLVRTTDGGRDFKLVALPRMQNPAIVGARFSSGADAWVALQSQPLDSQKVYPLQIFSTSDGGAHWHLVYSVSLPGGMPVQSVQFGAQDLMMVQPQHGMSSEPGFLYQLQSGGRIRMIAEQSYANEIPRGTGQLPAGGSVIATGSVDWLVAAMCTTCSVHLYQSVDGGRKWKRTAMWTPETVNHSAIGKSISELGSSHAGTGPYFVRSFDGPATLPQLLYRYSARKRRWLDAGPLPQPGQGTLAENGPLLSFANAAVGYDLAGHALYASADGGWRWVPVAGALPDSAPSARPVELDFVSKSTGFLLLHAHPQQGEDQSLLYITTDGGSFWKLVLTTAVTAV